MGALRRRKHSPRFAATVTPARLAEVRHQYADDGVSQASGSKDEHASEASGRQG